MSAEFANVAESFCAWAEAEAADPEAEFEAALGLIAKLYALGRALPESQVGPNVEPPSRDEWEARYRRFGALPFNVYSTVDRHVVPAEQFMTGDLADDLADIWSDLRGGIVLYRKGHQDAAVAHWAFWFKAHWGSHAAEALLALHSWVGTQE